MKALGSPDNAAERRAEAALGAMQDVSTEGLRYAPAAAPVASPSFHAVESVSFVVASNNDEAELFLRLGIDELQALVDDDSAHAAAVRFGELGFSPKPIARDVNNRAVLFERLGEGWRTARIDDLMQTSSVSRIIEMQKAVAAGKPFSRNWSVFDGIDDLWRTLSDKKVSLPDDAEWMMGWMQPIRATIEAAGVDMKPAHGDPHSSNVMVGPAGQLRLVDFDMAGDMDPYYSLGVLMNELYQFESQMKSLLEMHDGAFSEKAFNRCRLYAAADDLYWALRSMLLEVLTPPRGIEFLKYSGWRFLRCRMLLGRPGFEELLRSI